MATHFGYKLMSEEHGPRALIDNARRAEELGFDFVAISDHFHPWLEEQGHSPFAWTVLGAIADSTESIETKTAVTCPIVRYHPLRPGRFLYYPRGAYHIGGDHDSGTTFEGTTGDGVRTGEEGKCRASRPA